MKLERADRVLALVAMMTAVASCYDYSVDAPGKPGSARGEGTEGSGASSESTPESAVVDPSEVRAPDAAAPSDAGVVVVPSSSDAAASAVDAAPRCQTGAFYCGGTMVPGPADTLYVCNADGSSTLKAKCASGCTVTPAPADDACKPATTCVNGGAYCGGDKLDGDPNVLYRCGAGGTVASVIMACAKGCIVQPAGQDDTCR